MLASLRSRRLAFSWIGAVLVLGILVLLNVAAHFLHARWDFSAGRIYSISPGTRKILGALKDNLVIRVYYSPRLPQPYGLNETYLKSLLSEYKNASGGRVKVDFLNPDDNQTAKKEALTAGVSGVRLNVMGRDKFELRDAMMGMVLLYKGKTDVIPVLQNTADFEYDITRKIKKLSTEQRKTAAFVAGHGEKTPGEGPLQAIFGSMAETMEVRTADLSKPLPAGIDALWILGPNKQFPPAEIERLKAWAASGRSLGILLDRRWVDFRAFFSGKADTGLETLLESWGLDQREGFVVDAQAEKIQLEQQSGMFVMMNVLEYPYIPVATDFQKSHPATRGLDAVSLPFVHPISFKDKGAGLRYTSLLNSSAASWYVTEAKVSPYNPPANLDKAEKGPFSLAGVLEGDFYKAAPSTVAATERYREEVPPPNSVAKRPTGRVILVGTSRLIQPGLSIKPANVAFLLNLVEWSLQDESLLAVRSKGVTYRYLKPLSTPSKLAVKNAMIFGLPLVMVAAGAAVYRRQKKRRAALRSEYGP
ncbi:MAG: GldG family protein [Elusimicrobia bacterium]|nr:GldG family protein [Elusimicrobiota bacterium]